MQEIKMNGESLNIKQENIAKLKEIFPEVFNEDKIDFEKLQNVLGNYIDTDEEKYRFTWNGKMDALRLSQAPSTGTLRPCKEESKDWDTTQNLYIEGDNLEVLKLLQNSYFNKIKMIYIDPPYNTGNDFVYKDDFKDNITNYKKMTGQIDSEGNSTSTNKETDGRYHTNWLNMMYPRLRLARNLLTDDGVIFISIDDKEIANLKKICDEIYGEKNLIANMIWQSRTSISNDQEVSLNHNHTLIYSKNKNSLIFYGEPLNPDDYINPDGDPRGPWKLSPLDANKPGGDTYYPVINPDTNIEYYPPKNRSWAINRDEMQKLLNEQRIKFGINNDSAPKRKLYLYERLEKNDTKTPSSIILDGGTTKSGTTELMELFNGKKIFSYPKPTKLLLKFLNYALNKEKDNIILDFFSGSGTTAHAVLLYDKITELNISNKFIMIQIPENLEQNLTNEKDDAKKITQNAIDFLRSINKPPILTELGKERIRLAGDKIKEEIEQENQQLKLGEEPKKVPDIGFKVFKLDSSNIRKWNPDTKNLERTLLDQVDNFVEGRKEEDALYEIILKNGLPLTVPVEELSIKGKKVYSIGMGAMIVCLDNNITLDIADEIAKISTEFEDKTMVTVVFKDNGFENDSVKTNIKETLRGYGIGKFVTV